MGEEWDTLAEPPDGLSRARPTGTLWHGQTYTIVRQSANARYVIEDGAGVVVAFIPSVVGGLATTRENDWTLVVERRRSTWAVIAREERTGSEAGGILEGWLPMTHVLWVGGDSGYRLRQNPLSGRWSLSLRHQPVASIKPNDMFAASSIAYPTTKSTVGSITTQAATIGSIAKIELPVILALEFIKAERSVPRMSGGGG